LKQLHKDHPRSHHLLKQARFRHAITDIHSMLMPHVKGDILENNLICGIPFRKSHFCVTPASGGKQHNQKQAYV